MSNLIEVTIPDIGGHAGVDVIEVFVKVGDTIEKEQSLIALETDKATMEVPATHAGVIKEMKIKVGDKASEGDVVLLLEVGEVATAPAASAPAAAPVTAPAVPAAAGGLVEVKVPDIGGHAGVDVIEVFVKVGDVIEKEQSLIALETDKATMEVPSTHAGTVKEIKIQVGGKASEGDVVLLLEVAGAAAVSAPVAAPAPIAAAPVAAVPAAVAAPVAMTSAPAKIDEANFSKAHASPSVRKFARELGVDLIKVGGKGPKGRILHEDVQSFVKSVMTSAVASSIAAPAAGASLGGGIDLLPWPKVDFA
ncbi:MAG: biotin/lipoyl-containing protein, partial [Deefgea sp.]